MKRRIVISILSLLISIIMLASCGEHEKDNTDTETETEIESKTETETETETEIIPSEPVYTLTDDSSFYVVTGYTGNSGFIEIEQIHEGLRVIGISSGAFKDNTNLEEIVIPNSVEKIETSAFEGCTSLKTIVIPTGVREIEKSVFKGCTSLNNVKLHSKIQKINDYAFAECDSLESISLNDGLVSIGNNAFDYCSSLSSIVFPDTVETVGNMAFRYAQKLKSITFSKNLTAIGNATFQYCTGLESVSLPENIVSIGNSAFSFCDGLLELEILGDLTFFGNSAFYECHHIEKIYFCSSTETDLAENNYMLYNAGIKGDGITLTISSDACVPTKMLEPFTDSNHPNIKKIIVEDGATNVNYFSGSDYFPYLEEIELPDTITDITFGIFNNSLWWKEKPNGAVYISKILYGYKGELVSLSIIDGTLLVANDAFENCQDLKTLIIPQSVKIIGENAFASTGITTVRLDNDIEEIRKNAFNGCDSLEKVIFDGNKEELTSLNIAEGNEKLTSVEIKYNCDTCTPGEPVQENYVDSTCAEEGSYDMAIYCVDCLKELERTTEHAVDLKPHTYVNSYTCSKCSYVSEVESTGLEYTLNAGTNTYSVKEIGSCEDTKVVIPYTYNGKPVTKIASNAFVNKTSIKNIIIPNSIEYIGPYAFDGLTLSYNEYDNAYYLGNAGNPYLVLAKAKDKSITSCVINENTKFINYQAFDRCSSLTSIEIPDSVTSIGDNAFYWCDSLTSIEIPDSVTSIGDNAFDRCSSLASINVSENNTAYKSEDGVLYTKDGTTLVQYPEGKADTTFVIPNGVTSIGDNAFYSCSKLTSIEIPDGVTSIGDSAFYNCSKLTSIEIPDSVTSIGDNAFYSCSKLTSIEIPDSVTSIGDNAFYGCSSLESINVSENNTAYKSEDGVLYTKDGTVLIKYPANKYVSTFVIPYGVTSIGEKAFYSCDSLTSIEIPDGVTSIGDSAFYWCESLESINVSENNTAYKSIDGVLYTKDGTVLIKYPANKYVSTFVIPYGVTAISNYAFDHCRFTSIAIPDSVTSIGDGAFSNCSSLTSVTIGDSVTTIGSHAFSSCYDLTSVTFKNPNGWYVSASSSATSGTTLDSSDLSDASTAARYLKSTYCYSYWKRNDS